MNLWCGTYWNSVKVRRVRISLVLFKVVVWDSFFNTDRFIFLYLHKSQGFGNSTSPTFQILSFLGTRLYWIHRYGHVNMHVMHYLSYQYVHKSQSCETWVPQTKCRCVKILSQIYTFLANYSILHFLTLCPIILPRSPYYSFDICHYSHGDINTYYI